MIELLALTILNAILLITCIYLYIKRSDLQKMLDLVQVEISRQYAQCDINEIIEEIEDNCKNFNNQPRK